MADESIESVEDAFSLAADGAASVFALKIAKNGGPRAVLRTAHIAEAAGIALYGGTMLEGSVGTLASAHAFLTLKQLTWGTELFGPLLPALAKWSAATPWAAALAKIASTTWL